RYEEFIKKYEDEWVVKSVADCLGETAKRVPEKIETIVETISKYDGYVAEAVAEYLRETVDCAPEKIDTVTEVFERYEEFIKKYEDEWVVKAVAKCLGETAKRVPEKIDTVAKTIGKYDGRVAEVVAEYLRKTVDCAPEKIDTVAKTIGKYDGRVAEVVALCLGEIVEHVPEKIDTVAKTIGKYDGYVAEAVAEYLRETVERTPKEIDTVTEVFERYEEFIKKYEDEWVVKAVAKCLGETAKRVPEKIDTVAKTIGKYDGYVAEAVAEYLRKTVDCAPEKIDNIIDALDKLSKNEKEYIKYQQDLLKAPEDFFNFKKTYTFVEGNSIEANAKANEQLYKQGVEIIKGIINGSIPLNPDLEFLCPHELDSKTAIEMKKRLKDSRGQDIEAKNWLKEYEKRLSNLKKNYSKDEINILKEYYTKELENKDINSIDVSKFKETLSQVSQHYLGKDTKPGKKAAEISKAIIVSEGKLNTNNLKIEVWEKTLSDMPTYEEYHCCAFGNEKTLDYILNPAIQLVKLTVGDKKAMAIVASTTSSDGKKVLLLDSFESNSHIFARKEVAKAALEAMKEYAKEVGFDELLISEDAYNNAPQEFYENIEGQYGKRKLKLDVKMPEPYLEADLDEASGKIYKLK
ncbi:MAG: hypothetical protein QXL51_00830, partial [Candidatus Aenigmatarchaeota archaeon]